MAEKKDGTEPTRYGITLDLVEKLWVQKSLDLQKTALVRSRNKEMAGSEIYFLRQKEIDVVEALMKKIALA